MNTVKSIPDELYFADQATHHDFKKLVIDMKPLKLVALGLSCQPTAIEASQWEIPTWLLLDKQKDLKQAKVTNETWQGPGNWQLRTQYCTGRQGYPRSHIMIHKGLLNRYNDEGAIKTLHSQLKYAKILVVSVQGDRNWSNVMKHFNVKGEYYEKDKYLTFIIERL